MLYIEYDRQRAAQAAISLLKEHAASRTQVPATELVLGTLVGSFIDTQDSLALAAAVLITDPVKLLGFLAHRGYITVSEITLSHLKFNDIPLLALGDLVVAIGHTLQNVRFTNPILKLSVVTTAECAEHDRVMRISDSTGINLPIAAPHPRSSLHLLHFIV